MGATMTAARERPILFSGAMVRAILDGRKSQTRRVAKLNPAYIERWQHEPATQWEKECPYGRRGDRLWVREAWGYFGGDEYLYQQERGCVGYRADWIGYEPIPGGHWRACIHMPRWASRLTLELTGVRVERLHDITEADAEAEGFSGNDLAGTGLGYFSNREAFCDTWNKLNAPRGYGWAVNPWVWVLDFRRVTP